MSVASLPMYWRAETAEMWQEFWSVVQDCATAQGSPLPDLTPPDGLPANWVDHWLDPTLILSMTCGLPFRTTLRDKVQYVGTLDFGLTTEPGYYCSQIITGPDLSGPPRTLAYNSPDSQSGWAAAQDALDISTFTEVIQTGGHVASLAAVADGRADIACLDAVTWRILQSVDPNAAKVAASGTTRPTPGLPLITAFGTDPAPLRAVLATATKAFSPTDPDLIGGAITFCVLDPKRYYAEPIPAPPPA
ncbi:phosphate/phosphite/phosphonate ABC transporter substrate-binding protein [Marivita sp.]|uniref:phosphate/phosphite/phosphonate ABC transporter substrate-binding protein n=1 Tax=Marivita sp. TaxID=2003365 RepID=UPI003F6D00F7